MRREWINEDKPRQTFDEDQANDERKASENPDETESGRHSSSIDVATKIRTPPRAHDSDNDLYSATPEAVLEESRRKRKAEAEHGLFVSDDEDNRPLGDELDALMAENNFE